MKEFKYRTYYPRSIKINKSILALILEVLTQLHCYLLLRVFFSRWDIPDHSETAEVGEHFPHSADGLMAVAAGLGSQHLQPQLRVATHYLGDVRTVEENILS